MMQMTRMPATMPPMIQLVIVESQPLEALQEPLWLPVFDLSLKPPRFRKRLVLTSLACVSKESSKSDN